MAPVHQTEQGRLLAELRNHAGVSQAKLANLSGISVSMVGLVESGSRNLSERSARKVADALTLRPADRKALMAALEADALSGAKPDDSPLGRKVADMEEALASVLVRLDALEGANVVPFRRLTTEQPGAVAASGKGEPPPPGSAPRRRRPSPKADDDG